jgi:hypothetical protein
LQTIDNLLGDISDRKNAEKETLIWLAILLPWLGTKKKLTVRLTIGARDLMPFRKELGLSK